GGMVRPTTGAVNDPFTRDDGNLGDPGPASTTSFAESSGPRVL
ncbi:MAG: hypothetical protein AVDCRST_MAG73-710, partial [uncultured Thermomicrobiales bacterium]